MGCYDWAEICELVGSYLLKKVSNIVDKKSIALYTDDGLAKDSTQLWHRYDKVLGKKTNNIVEPIYDTESGLHIFDDKEISEKLQKFHIEKIEKNEFDLQFKHEISKQIDSVLELNQTSSSEIFCTTYIKQAIRKSNKSSALFA